MTHFAWLKRRLRRSLRARLGALVLTLIVLPPIFAELLAADQPIVAFGPDRVRVLPAIVSDGGGSRSPDGPAPAVERAIWPLVRYGPASVAAEGPNAGFSWEHPLGTDGHARDVAARLLYGTRRALGLSVLVVLVALGLGGLLGALAGYRGGVFDELVARPVEFVQAFPSIVVVAVVRAVDPDGDLWSLVLAIAAVRWAEVARLVRVEVARLYRADFIAAARVLGCPRRRIVYKHVAPHVAMPITVSMMFAAASVVLLEVAVSFLGLGLPGSLGGLIAEGLIADGPPVAAICAGLIVGLTVLAVHLVADALSENLDARASTTRRRRTWGPVVP